MGQPNSQPQSSYGLITAQWEWKSNLDPWSKSESPQWLPYNLKDNYQIERAYVLKKSEVDLGNYIVSFKRMLQQRKGDPYRQRPIRRSDNYLVMSSEIDEEADDVRERRFFGVETPKTINGTFKTLSDYLTFFGNRGDHRIEKCAQVLLEAEVSKNIDGLNKTILPIIIQCIVQESEYVTNSQNKKEPTHQQKYLWELIILFQNKFSTLEQFYSRILKAYTMDGFLYRNLNQYFRNEDWTQLDRLLPYVYCLCKAFSSIGTIAVNDQQQQNLATTKGGDKLVLYKGASLDKELLSFYDSHSIKNFSWNSFTSTSTNRAVAEKLMYRSSNFDRTRVMFVIEVDLNRDKQQNTNWVDMKPFSAYPKEDEVVLAPGLEFEVSKVTTDSDEEMQIHLRVMDNVLEKGQILSGFPQSRIASNEVVKIASLEKEVILRALSLLKRNRFVKGVEFSSCVFDKKVQEKAVEVLQTMSNLDGLIFINSEMREDGALYSIIKELRNCKIQNLEVVDKELSDEDVTCLMEGVRHWRDLRSLKLDASSCLNVTDDVLKNLGFVGIRHLSTLTTLTLEFGGCKGITDTGVSSLSCEGLRHSSALTVLTLNFKACKGITDAGVSSFSCDGLRHLTALRILTLNFGDCEGVTDAGLSYLSCDGLRHLTALIALNLDFGGCKGITDAGVSSFSYDGLRHLSTLTALTLNIERCKGITDSGMSVISYEGLSHLSTLMALTLNFRGCEGVTDAGISSLSSHCLHHLSALTSLSLDFTNCKGITDTGVSSLSHEGLCYLSALTDLTLDFGGCKGVTDTGMISLIRDGLSHLSALKTLTLHLRGCEGITDAGVSSLRSGGPHHLSLLTALTIDFGDCKEVTDEGTESLQQRPIQMNVSYFAQSDKINNAGNIKRTSEIGAPKTINKTFGALSDYLKFFQNRTMYTKKCAQILQEAESSQNLDDLNKIVLPLIIDCLRQESKYTGVPQNSNNFKLNKQEQQKYISTLTLLFQNTFATLKEFYSSVLRAFSMDGFLRTNLNYYLRNEDWAQLDRLLPYGFCLCKAFFYPEIFPLNNSKNGSHQNFVDAEEHSRLVLYKGASLDKVSLSLYDHHLTKNFCWNTITSTSTNLKVAERFMYTNTDSEKIPIMFIIEVSSDNTRNRNWIDMRPFSVFPAEDEVILAPGSTFEITRISKDSNHIHLRLIDDISELAYRGQIMHGAMQSEMIADKVAKIVCMEKEELLEALSHLRANQIVEEVEFSLCKFDERTQKGVVEILQTMKNLNSLIVVSPSSGGRNFYHIFEELRECNIQTLEVIDKDLLEEDVFCLSEGVGHWKELRSLSIDASSCLKITDAGLVSLSSRGLRCLSTLASLSLNFTECSLITDEGLASLSSESLHHLSALISLTLNFAGCDKITDKGLTNLSSEGLRHLSSLTSLTLNFKWCGHITDEGLTSLSSEGLHHLSALTSLTVYFGGHDQITDSGLASFSYEGLCHLSSLTSLSLYFGGYNQITDTGLYDLGSEGLQNLLALTSLTLDFRSCKSITDAGLASLSSEGLRHLSVLTSMSLNFSGCKRITDAGISNINSEGIRHLSNLTSMALDFNLCDQITDAGREKLKVILSHYKALTSSRPSPHRRFGLIRRSHYNAFSSEFKQDSYSTSNVQNSLVHWTLKDLIEFEQRDEVDKITQLEIKFSQCDDSAVIEKRHLQHLRNLFSLGSVTLSFKDYKNMTDTVVSDLSSDGLRHITTLTSLGLDFEGCKHITDAGLRSLSSDGLRHLSSLTCLTLEFKWCDRITDTGVQSLSFQGLRYLTSLTSLNLDFTGCYRITDEGVSSLSSEGLRHLPSLTLLSLDFSFCDQITDAGLATLASGGLRHLCILTSLVLNFRRCKGITDTALANFTKILKYFGFYAK